jgi:hypothetical protein
MKRNLDWMLLIVIACLGTDAFAEEIEWKPRGFPPLVLTVSAEDTSSDSNKISWKLKISNVEKKIWNFATGQMPDVAWPDMEWAKPRTTFASSLGTAVFPVSGVDSADMVRVVDLSGNPVERKKVIEKLKEKKRTLVSFDGKLPDPAYRRYLPAQSDLVVILGGGEATGTEADSNQSAAKPLTRIQDEADLSKVTDDESRKYSQGLANRAKINPMIENVAGFKEFAEGIWRVDRLAHAHRGNYLVSRDGADAFLIFSDKWLVTGMFQSNKETIRYEISSLDKIKSDPKTPGGKVKGAFEVEGDFFGFLKPAAKSHLVWAAYDWWVIYKRVK